MNWDTEIWAPCRLGEAFTLRDLGHEHTQYLYGIKADWLRHRGDAMCVRSPDDLKKEHPQASCLGAGPRPWANCWTYEAKIKITPPVWCWDMQDDTMFGLELKPKRNGNRRKVKLDCVKIHEGRPVYRVVVEKSDGDTFLHLDSIPILDPYFAPIWPATAEETQEVAEPAPEPVADPVAETLATVGKVAEPVVKPAETVIETPKTVTNATEPEQTGPEAEQTGTETAWVWENSEQTLDSENSTSMAILPSANWPGRTYYTDAMAAVAFAMAPEPPPLQCRSDPGQLPQLSPDLRRRLLTTSNATNMVAAHIAQTDEDAPASWTGTENRPPGACIGGRTPFSGKYYYYVWFEEPPTEGETYEQKTGP